jgi:transposase-like protein
MTSSDQRHYIEPLTSVQRDRLEGIAASATLRARQRARLLLLLDAGTSVTETAAQVGLSPSGVRYWIKRYRAVGMGIFDGASPVAAPGPAQTDELEGAERAADLVQPSAGTAAAADTSTAAVTAITLDALCRQYSVDEQRARHITDFALQLFDATPEVHGLDARARRLLDAAGQLHGLAYPIDPAGYHLLGRDTIRRYTLDGFTDVERDILACLTAFHRKTVSTDDALVFNALSADDQALTLDLAALLRIAHALDYSRSQTCRIAEIRAEDGLIMVLVEGDYADLNAERAVRAADVWHDRFPVSLQVQEQYPAEAIRHDVVWARLEPDMRLPATSRALMEHYVTLVEQHADRLRGQNDEALSLLERDLARLQGVFEHFGAAFDATALTGFKKDVRWLYRQVNTALSARVLAVLTREEAPHMIPETSGKAAEQLEQSLDDWQQDAVKAMRKLRKALDSARYRSFLTGLLGFCRTQGKGEFPGRSQATAIGTQAALMIWQRYVRLRTEGPFCEDAAEQWRLVRQLHNMLQYMGGMLGPELRTVLSTIQPLDAGLRDILLGQAALDALVKAMDVPKGSSRKKNKKKHRARDKQVRASLEKLSDLQRDWLAEACTELTPLWGAVDSIEFRQQLALAVAEP